MELTKRPRRLRGSENLRKMVRETRMDKSSLMYPMFVMEGENKEEEIPSMTGQYRYSLDRLPYKLEQLSKAGVGSGLLAIARYDNSKVIMHNGRFSVNRLAASVIKSMSGLCQPGTFELKSQTGNIELTADKVMIRQLLGILLDNAVKYTGDNKKIAITLEKIASSVKITVKDNAQ